MSEYLGSLFPPKVFISSAQKMYIWNEKKRRVRAHILHASIKEIFKTTHIMLPGLKFPVDLTVN